MRRLLLLLGVLTLAAVWLGPLADAARRAFSAHMLMHMGVVAVASPLLALGVRGGRFDPVLKMPRLFAPIPASVLELVVVWTWHAPMLHHLARHSTIGLIAEQGMFLISALLLWLSAYGGIDRHDARRAGGVVGLLLTSMHMTLLGALLALAPRALYVHADGFAGLTPLADQALGGAIMLLIGSISYFLGGLGVMAGLLRSKEAGISRAGPKAYRSQP